ncbi:1-phosphofructokinase family hexose kinase [Amaricoccus macauensis]|uniref:1-phosphofructokinase family hexose kinase n=1 Tax=Amaricoccus macauensis TaxID=57001 RepID=UPI003C7E7DD5
MKQIVTLTLNPCVDGSCETETVHPTHKIRTHNQRYDPGGGGINVSRVVSELGGGTTAVYLSGGAIGRLLDDLLAEMTFETKEIPISAMTRMSQAVIETATHLEYRFTPEGPTVTPDEWTRCLSEIREMDFDYLVASGSCPKGLPVTCYCEVSDLARERGAKFVLDTSGEIFEATVAHGGIHLAKPSLGELRKLLGKPLHTAVEIEAAAIELTNQGNIELAAVTMGSDGAMLAGNGEAIWLRPPEVEVTSAVGAGDSFLGGMLYALSQGQSPSDAFTLGTAAGTAAVITPGTELCRKADIERFRDELTRSPDRSKPSGYTISG